MGATSLLDRMPKTGNSTNGTKAVTVIDVPSPIHQMAINSTTAKRRWPDSVIPSGCGKHKIKENTNRPTSKTAICFLNLGSVKEWPLAGCDDSRSR